MAGRGMMPAGAEATTAATSTGSRNPRPGRALMQGLRGHMPRRIGFDESGHRPDQAHEGGARRGGGQAPGESRLPAEPAHGGQVGEPPGPERHPGAEDRWREQRQEEAHGKEPAGAETPGESAP